MFVVTCLGDNLGPVLPTPSTTLDAFSHVSKNYALLPRKYTSHESYLES